MHVHPPLALRATDKFWFCGLLIVRSFEIKKAYSMMLADFHACTYAVPGTEGLHIGGIVIA